MVDGRLEDGRLESWRRLGREVRALERRRDEATRRAEDRKLGKFYKRVLAAKKDRLRTQEEQLQRLQALKVAIADEPPPTSEPG